MAIKESRILKAKWTTGENSRSQSFSGVKPDALPAQMNAFFSAIAPLSIKELSYRGYEDTYALVEEE